MLPDVRTRTWTCWLVALGGGIEVFILPAVNQLGPDQMSVVGMGLWPLQGWTTFQSFYNPLWILVRLAQQPAYIQSLHTV